jgi:hypothetical protein
MFIYTPLPNDTSKLTYFRLTNPDDPSELLDVLTADVCEVEEFINDSFAPFPLVVEELQDADDDNVVVRTSRFDRNALVSTDVPFA